MSICQKPLKTRFASRKTWKFINVFVRTSDRILCTSLEGRLVISKQNYQTYTNEQKIIQSLLKKQCQMWRQNRWYLRRDEVNMSTERVLSFCNIYELKIQQKASVLCLGLSGLFREQTTNMEQSVLSNYVITYTLKWMREQINTLRW